MIACPLLKKRMRDGAIVRASASQSVKLDSIPL